MVLVDNDGFESIPIKQKIQKSKRLYIGNLPTKTLNEEDLEDELKRIVQERTKTTHDITVEVLLRQESHAALVNISGVPIEHAIQNLKGVTLGGRKLSVQRRPRNNGKNNKATTSSSSFGVSSWSKPPSSKQKRAPPTPPVEKKFDDVSEHTAANVQDEMNGSRNDPVTSALAATAAVTLAVSANMGDDDGPADDDAATPKEKVDFHALCQEPLTNLLLDEYGEQDLNWRNKQPELPTTEQTPAVETANKPVVRPTSDDDDAKNRLERHGKAPVHVEFATFGYVHGIPGELKSAATGNSYTLPAFDCRCIAEVPHYLAWMDGSSGAVRNALLRQTNKVNKDDSAASSFVHVRDYANTVVATAVADAVVAAIDQGGHGYALPLRMVVHLGSESGRHRSVVCAELAATALRKMLRKNTNDRFKAPVSVGTRHRDIDTQQQQRQQRNKKPSFSVKKPKKQKDLEDD